MSDVAPLRGIVVAHGALSRGLVDAVTKISGVDEGAVIPLSNEGKSPETLQGELDGILGTDPAVVFTDLPSGSCALAARLCCRARPNQVVISGVNLPMLLDFVFNRDRPLEELIPRLLSRGIGSVTSAPEFS